MYEVSNEVKETIVKDMCEELGDRNYPYSYDAIKKIVNKSIEVKSSLIDLLSRHPNWIPDKLMIQFDSDYNRQFSTDALYHFGRWIERAIRKERDLNNLDYDVLHFIQNKIVGQFFNETMDYDINQLNEENTNFKLRNNMKASKAILKLCKEMGYDKLPHLGELWNSTPERIKYDDFNYEYALLCDNINPIKTTRHTCISLNPIDYLLMSNGDSWQSCHDIGDFEDEPGCYSSGTISYMLDECSFIFYTVDKDYDGKHIELEEKVQRQVFGYKDEVFIQSRLYPQSMDYGAEAIYTDIRNIVQKVIADCLEKPNFWSKTTSDVNDIVVKGVGATCYPDWYRDNPGAKHCSISRIKGTTNHPLIVLGAKPICIECGGTHDVNDNINCCSSRNGHYCEGCGDWVDEDDEYWVGDYAYCRDCVTYCEDCGDYEVNDYVVEINYIDGWGHHSTKYVCESCANDYYRCECCGELWDCDNMTITTEDNWYCPDCDDNWFICDNCGDIHDSNYMNYDDQTGNNYCNDCYEDILEEREEKEEDDEYEEAV